MQRRDRTDDLEVPRREIFICGVLSWLSDGSFESCFLCCVTFHLFLSFLLFTLKKNSLPLPFFPDDTCYAKEGTANGDEFYVCMAYLGNYGMKAQV